MQYVQDSDERYPMDKGGDWCEQLYPYVKANEIFTCPSDKAKPGSSVSELSYGINQSIASPKGIYYAQALLAGQFNDPAKTVGFFEMQCLSGYGVSRSTHKQSTVNAIGNGRRIYDAYATNLYYGAYTTGFMGGLSSSPLSPACNDTYGCFVGPDGIHNQGANFCFADGHVKWMLGSHVSTGMIAGQLGCDQDSATAGCRGKWSNAGVTGNFTSQAASTDTGDWEATFSPV